jgi:hypothetical protein
MSIDGAKYLPTSEQLVTVRQKIEMQVLTYAVKVTSNSLDHVYKVDLPELAFDT